MCEAISRVVELLKIENNKAKVKNLYKQQERERESLKEAYLKEYDEFMSKWNQRIELLKADIETLKQALSARHEEETKEFIERFHEDLRNRTPKFSKQLLNMRKIQDTLAKNKNFGEATRMKKAADRLQNEELVRISVENGERFEKKRTSLMLKQKQEMEGFELRLQRELREMELQRDREYVNMNKRHNNFKQTLLGNHYLIESKTKAFLSKQKASDKASNTLYKSMPQEQSTMWSLNTKSILDPYQLWATNIKSECYQSRPFTVPIPVQCDASSFSEITRTVANNILQKERSSPPKKPMMNHTPSNHQHQSNSDSVRRSHNKSHTLGGSSSGHKRSSKNQGDDHVTVNLSSLVMKSRPSERKSNRHALSPLRTSFTRSDHGASFSKGSPGKRAKREQSPRHLRISLSQLQ